MARTISEIESSPLKDTAKQHLVMIGSGPVPIQSQTVRVLTEPGEVVYCGYYGRYGMAGQYLDFGRGCFRASRRVYESLPLPWFDLGCDATLTRKTQCECARFAGRLQAAGIETLPIGVIGRLTQVVLIPARPGRMRIVLPYTVALAHV